MKLKRLTKTRFKSFFTVLLCALTAVWALAGCSWSYTLNEDAADKLTSGVYSEEADSSVSQELSEAPSEAESNGSEQGQGDEASANIVTYSFRNEKLLNDHFEKHNEDFGYATVEEYVEGANRVINDESSLHKLEAEDGDDVYYLEETNEFVIVSTDGYIRTYFKPSRGIDYYNAQ